jgi:hypothetical protein
VGEELAASGRLQAARPFVADNNLRLLMLLRVTKGLIKIKPFVADHHYVMNAPQGGQFHDLIFNYIKFARIKNLAGLKNSSIILDIQSISVILA